MTLQRNSKHTAMTPLSSKPRVFGVDYQFLSCGDVFTKGLAHAAVDLGVIYDHCDWSDPTLAGRVQILGPDVLLVVHGRRFSQRHHNMAAFRVPTAIWLLDEPYEVDNTAEFSKRFDYVFVNDAATLARHHNATVLPVCYDPHVHTSSGGPRAYDVGFIGGGNGTRDRYLAALARAGLLSYVVGGAWADPLVHATCLSPNIPPARTVQLYQQTKIVLNVFREKHHYNRDKVPATALNPRVYEALACGALVVSEWRPEVEALVPELPTFQSVEDCVGIIGELLNDPARAERIRTRCAERLQPHTYGARLQTVLQTVGAAVAV